MTSPNPVPNKADFPLLSEDPEYWEALIAFANDHSDAEGWRRFNQAKLELEMEEYENSTPEERLLWLPF